MKILFPLLLILLSSTAFGAQKRDNYNFWPRIPFNIEGANLCEFKAAFSQTRSEYVAEMVEHAERLLLAGDLDPFNTLLNINKLYGENLRYAKQGLGVTLENSFKTYLGQFYRDIRPRVQRLNFKYVEPVDQVIQAALAGAQVNIAPSPKAGEVNLFAYGTYSMSPNCNGGVAVTLTIINSDGYTRDYTAQGPAHTVMSSIATQVFDDFQRTTFPSTLKTHKRTLHLLGDLTGDIGVANNPRDAEVACEEIGARLPKEIEYKILDAYGTYSGGVSLGGEGHYWAMSEYKVFIPGFKHMKVRDASSVGRKQFKYICVR